MATCTKCGLEVPDGSTFCSGCGAAVETEPAVEVTSDPTVITSGEWVDAPTEVITPDADATTVIDAAPCDAPTVAVPVVGEVVETTEVVEATEVIEAVPVAPAPAYVAPPPPPPKEKPKWKKWLIPAIALLVLLPALCCGLVMCMGGDNEADQPDIVDVVPDINDLEVSPVTPAPTTPTEPTEPAQTETTMTDEEATVAEYELFAVLNASFMAASMEQLKTMATEMDDTNFAATNDTTWLDDADTYASIVEEGAKAFVDFPEADVPAKYRDTHKLFVSASKDLLTAMTHFRGAADGNNAQALSDFNTSFESGRAAMEKALTEFESQYSGN